MVRVICIAAGFVAAEARSLAEIAAQVNSLQTTWGAQAPDKFSSTDDVKIYLGAYLPGDAKHKKLPVKQVLTADVADIPESFDARTQWSNCTVISNIRDQSSCGSCWAFGSTDSFQDRACIATGKDVQYSAEDTAFCSDAGDGCQGGNTAWDWFTYTGVATGGDYTDAGKGDTCLPYSLAPCAHHVPATSKYPVCPSGEYPSPQCTGKCSESGYSTSKADDKFKASNAYSVEGVTNIQTELLTHGPLYVAFTVYDDFPTYKSGVYKHTSSSALGGHAVELIGWGTESGTDYWLVKNSWNEQWGDNGLFKIVRGTNECGIEDDVSGGTFGGPSPGPSPSPPGPSSCDYDTSQSSCESDGCKWCVYPFGGFCFPDQCEQLTAPPVATAAKDKPLIYVQVQCHDANCSGYCNGGPVPQDECIGSTGGGAASLHCYDTYLEEKLWSNGDCSGDSDTTTQQPLNVCTLSSEGLYFENLCTTDNPPAREFDGAMTYLQQSVKSWTV